MRKFVIRSPRYLNGEYVYASPEHPTVVELPADTKVDRGLEPLEGEAEAAPQKPRPHFAERTQPHVQSKRVERPKEAKEGEKPAPAATKRASDVTPV